MINHSKNVFVTLRMITGFTMTFDNSSGYILFSFLVSNEPFVSIHFVLLTIHRYKHYFTQWNSVTGYTCHAKEVNVIPEQPCIRNCFLNFISFRTSCLKHFMLTQSFVRLYIYKKILFSIFEAKIWWFCAIKYH